MWAHPYVLEISDEDYKYLQTLIHRRTIQAQVVDRAKILIYKSQGASNSDIADCINVNINTVRLCLDKYIDGGVQNALFDKPRKGRSTEISDDAVAWIISIACQRPADLGYAQELWTLKNLHKHIQAHAADAGFPRLETVSKARVSQLLKKSEIKPFKIKYYRKKRDPLFESKMRDVLLICKQVEMQFDKNGESIANTTEDLRPTEENGDVYRDYEYKRLGTLSLLAGIDLLTGMPYRLSATHSFLSTMPDEMFEFVFTPKHGSWLNMIKSFFSKMTKQMLRGIRVKSKEELMERIYNYFDEIIINRQILFTILYSVSLTANTNLSKSL
ncbi:MAG: helix-turn-helix domain-containing protein [Ruminococcus flavefaciens]|nr:helix-turn-helix domain-containing protein [Ruminococcus flavefaciens]